MNPTFKVTPAAAQFDIIHYTAPPPYKPKRAPVSQRREAIPGKCSLPELATNFVFDGLDEFPEEAEPAFAPSLDRAGATSQSPTLNGGPEESNSAASLAAEKPECDEVPAKSVLNKSDESQEPDQRQLLPVDQGTTLDQREPSLPHSTPVAAHNMGMDNVSLGSDNAVHDVYASARIARLESGQAFRGRATRERESEEPEFSCDDVDPSYPLTSEPQCDRVEDDTGSNSSRSGPRQRMLESAKPRLRVEVQSRHSQFGKLCPQIVLPRDQGSATFKAPRFPAGRSMRAFGHEADESTLKSKRGAPTMANPVHKRSRRVRRIQAREEYDALPSDSEASYTGGHDLARATDSKPTQRPLQHSRASRAAGALKRKLRRGGGATSIGAHSHPTVPSEAETRSKISMEASLISGNFGTAARDPPTLLNPSNPSMASTEAAVLTAIVADVTQIGALLTSPAAWGLTKECFSTATLLSATVEPFGPEQWHLTATFAQLPGVKSSVKATSPETDIYNASDSDESSDSAYDVRHRRSENGPGSRSQGIRRGGWQKEDDDNLIEWKRLGMSWPWIFEKFPDRTKGAVKSHWYVVLSPQQKSHKG